MTLFVDPPSGWIYGFPKSFDPKRANFRNEVFKRDNYRCRICGVKGSDRNKKTKEELEELDAHHITNRTEMPNGGYIKENGISLCSKCHKKAEMYYQKEITEENFSPEKLYSLIGSSKEKALRLDS